MIEYLTQLLYNPFSFQIESDRFRRSNYAYYGKYQPTKFKRFMIWLLNERIDPVDWEEVPPFVEPNDDLGSLITSRDGQLHPYECLTQPDMLTKRDIHMRRFLLVGVFYLIYKYLEKHQLRISNILMMDMIYYQRVTFKFFLLGWFYYMSCRIFVHRDYQMPYN